MDAHLFMFGQMFSAAEWITSKQSVERGREELFRVFMNHAEIGQVGPKIHPIHDITFNAKTLGGKIRGKVTTELPTSSHIYS